MDRKHSCYECKHFYSCGPTFDQPYPEFTCIKNHWSGITSTEEYDMLFEDNDCKDFEDE